MAQHPGSAYYIVVPTRVCNIRRHSLCMTFNHQVERRLLRGQAGVDHTPVYDTYLPGNLFRGNGGFAGCSKFWMDKNASRP